MTACWATPRTDEKGVRDNLLLVSGGTQVTDELANEWGMEHSQQR